MIKKIIQTCLLLFTCLYSFAQGANTANDSSINNLIHLSGYKTSAYGEVPQYIKKGKGKKILILIPGLGFDASVFEDFMEANKKNYTMYAVTTPGFGATAAPPMPDTGTSYGVHTWNKGMVEGLAKFIKKEKLDKPIIVGHFIHGVQLAVRFAARYPELTGGLILAGGSAKFIVLQNGKLADQPESNLIRFVDTYTAPVWFRHMKKEFFDNGNFTPDIYSLDEKTGKDLWKQVAAVPLPVMVRYSCEYFATDVIPLFEKIKCPVLVLRANFKDAVWENPGNANYLKPQFINSWDKVASGYSFVTIKDIKDAAAFVWKDKPEEVYKEIKDFLDSVF